MCKNVRKLLSSMNPSAYFDSNNKPTSLVTVYIFYSFPHRPIIVPSHLAFLFRLHIFCYSTNLLKLYAWSLYIVDYMYILGTTLKAISLKLIFWSVYVSLLGSL